jgi:cytochrome c-type biogenesis protein CcmE
VKRYWRFVIPAGLLVAVLVVLLVNLSSSLVYFVTPTDLIEAEVEDDRSRLGGQVEAGSVVVGVETVSFRVTDGRQAVDVIHTGAPQQLFQEGIGVVVEGRWDGSTFHSDTMLVRHDEQYRTEDGSVYEEGDPSSVTP